MATHNADGATLGNAMDMIDAEAEVVEAAMELDRAQAAVAVAEDEEERLAAQARLAAAQARLEEALCYASVTASVMREGLQRRHGGIHQAVTTAPQGSAERGFYTGGQ